PRNPNSTAVREQTGRLMFSVPFLAMVWYGWTYGASIYSLYHTSITKHNDDIKVEFTDFNQSASASASIPPTRPLPAYIRNFVDRNHFHTPGLPLGLEFLAPQTAFGPLVQEVTEEAIDYRPNTPVETPPSPE
ncbi:hypothetical protein FRC07_013091, partial [Ceratobasidium sp. 392]